MVLCISCKKNVESRKDFAKLFTSNCSSFQMKFVVRSNEKSNLSGNLKSRIIGKWFYFSKMEGYVIVVSLLKKSDTKKDRKVNKQNRT